MNRYLISFFIFSLSLIPFLSAEPTDTEFTRGYIYSKLEDRFCGYAIEFEVGCNQIIVYSWPECLDCEDIKTYLESCISYPVVCDSCYIPLDCSAEQCICVPIQEGNFLPELSPFFPTMLAQPHIIGYSAGYRSYDRVFKVACIPVSIGDQFSFYQFNTCYPSRLYLGIEACVWAIFEARAKSLSLINADYFVGLPLTYFNNNFSAKLRIYHQSSHLGDEFLLENRKKIRRVNPSMEVADLSLAYDLSNWLTTFVGYSRVLRSDKSYRVKPNGIFYGFNYYLNFFKVYVCNVEGVPYISTYFNNLENNRWKLDSNVAFGYQWDKLYGHKLRIYVEGHNGHSEEGQFTRQKTRYVAVKLLYGY